VAPVIRTLALEYANQEYRAAIEDELH